MHVSEIKEHLDQTPFVPFRVYLSDGSSHDVPHPEFVLLTKWALHIAESPQEGDLPERVTRVAIGHITRLEEIQSSAA